MTGTASKAESRESRVKSRRQRRRRSTHRGVLLMVVLAMLVLFMLIGTAFLMSSSQSRDAAKAGAKKDRLGNLATKLLDRAAYAVLRDTDNPASALRYHSLLRDLYGTDGFQAAIYSPPAVNLLDTTQVGQATRFAGATAGTPDQQLGPTRGQFIDIYVRALAFGADDPLTPPPTNEATLALPDLRHVLKVDRNGVGQPQLHSLPLTKGYYNGCLLTITSGLAAGQSTRILDYEYVADIPPANTSATPPISSRLFRFRVMAFPRADGQPLQINQSAARSPEISDLAGATILVNGRPFSGTGVGYNPLAAAGTPRLNAVQIVPLLNGSGEIGEEIALTPNSRYVFAETPGAVGALPPSAGFDAYPSATSGLSYPVGTFLPLNTTTGSGPTLALAYKYGLFPGPGSTNEDYDAADFQNMILSLQTVTPRARGRVVHSSSTVPLEVDNPDVFNNTADFLRLDLEDVPLPSLHRPALANFWFHRLLNSEWLTAAIGDENDRAKAILQPYQADGVTPSPWVGNNGQLIAAQITALKRKISMRPLREDNPRFNGSNTQSVAQVPPGDAVIETPKGSGFFQFAIPFWEVTGPWDVDNDNDGVPDSIWVDLGDAIQEAEDGTRYKPLYAILCIDLDSRLNVNAHGLVDHINPFINGVDVNHSNLSYVEVPGLGAGNGPNLAGTTGTNVGATMYSTDQLATGSGYGPPEISLRPVFPVPFANSAGALDLTANRVETNPVSVPIDSYAALLTGRVALDGEGISGRFGFQPPPPVVAWPQESVTPGMNYRVDTTKSYDQFPELTTAIKFFDYPINVNFRTAFGTPPDLFGRYAMGLGFDGQPVYEVLNDRNANSPASPIPNRPLLTDSPYELNLSKQQRRDTWSASFALPAGAFDMSVDKTNVGGPPGVNDDAPFATTDLERVLRAFDADAGALPSRLWDVVDTFDPIKMAQFDPYRVESIAQAAFGDASISVSDLNDRPEILTAAQQIAAVNRRLVTTDSYSLPVPSMTPPAYLLVDDDPSVQLSLNARPPKSVAEMLEVRIRRELGFPTLHDEYDPDGNHDYPVDADPNSADADYSNQQTVTDRNVRALRISAIINGGMWLDASNKPHYESGILAPELIAGRQMDLNRPFGDGRDNAGDGRDSDNDGFIDATDYNGNGVIDGPDANGDGIIDELVEAGDLMNRADGVVDDPLESGDPFLDVDGNGKWFNEPYIDLDGDGQYSPPRDQLWGGLGLAESISFDYTNGAGVPIHPAEATVGNFPPNAVVRNLQSQARQLYARHLYCLMLMLVDAGYIAPYDENDPQIKEYLDTTNKGSQIARNLLASFGADPNAAQKTRQILLRKLTCRMIAQWAVNCVDMRDADAAMTPFEYDEYPWDGWGCLDRTGENNIALDGDPATNENGDETLLEAQLASSNMVAIIDWNSLKNGGPKTTINTLVPGPSSSQRQTRGLVWGTERPDLLITETFAFHDRRTEDTNSDWTRKYLIGAADQQETAVTPGRSTLDQRLRPRGGLFVELYNPWSPTGQYPTELYSLFDTQTGRLSDRNGDGFVDARDFLGVELGRVSTYGALQTSPTDNRLTVATGANIKRSPVWRLIVVEENPDYRNNLGPVPERVDDEQNPLGTKVHDGKAPDRYYAAPAGSKAFFEAADPDFGSRYFYGQEKPTSGKFPANEPYVERSIYFTSDNSDRFNRSTLSALGLVKNPEDKLRLPPQTPQSARYFIAADVRKSTVPSATDIPDVPIAPIKPGRYAVVGTAGTQYTGLESRLSEVLDANGAPVPVPVPRFVTTLSRQVRGTTQETLDSQHKSGLDKTRRIELLPSANPEVQQVLVAANGGTPLFPRPGRGANDPVQRDNEVVKLPNGQFRNIFDYDNDGNPDPLLVPPCVAIPVANMSASEPLDVYAARASELRTSEKQEALDSGLPVADPVWNPLAAEGEGAYVRGRNPSDLKSPAPFNEPFDVAWELMRNGTTRNYRTVHLQRLADPTLPWNPLPALPDGKPNPQHDPKLPVNLYLTIDTASVDLTAYNGASSREPDDPTTGVVSRNARYLPEQSGGSQAASFEKVFGPQGRAGTPTSVPHRINFRSLERGWHATATTTAGELELSPRELWRQEPVTRQSSNDPDKLDASGVFTNDMAEWRALTPTGDPNLDSQARQAELRKRVNDLRIRNTTMIDKDVDAIKNGLDGEFGNFPRPDDPSETRVPVWPRKHHWDIVFKHSLGFQNESFGALTTRADVVLQGLPQSADGTPTRDAANGGFEKFSRAVPNNSVTLSTYPWLAWNNRPLISAEELLQVPATSSSKMLRNFSTINSNPSSNLQPPNPYDGRGVDAMNAPLTVAARLAAFKTPFGHLLNMFQTADFPARIATDASGNPVLDSSNNWAFVGAPNFFRILDFVQVPSRFVGTDDTLTAEIFNDVPGVLDATTGGDITGPLDPRYYFQPPFNKVSRERDPGKVNLNTVTGRRMVDPVNGIPRHWSEVFDGIMQRYPFYDSTSGTWYAGDGNLPPLGGNSARLGHGGPAWRDVVLSRRGYAQLDAAGTSVDKPPTRIPDALGFGLNSYFPTFFSNPFRSSEAGDLVPLPQMLHFGIDVGWLRGHHYNRGGGTFTGSWGAPNTDDNNDGSVDDTREAGFGGDDLNANSDNGELLPTFGAPVNVARGSYPLFSESFTAPYVDGERNPYFYYQPMTRLGNLVTNRSNVYAIWITVGYFEVEPAPPWSDPNVQNRFGGNNAASLALFRRVYPDGYMLGKELGSDTGDIHRHRGFYIVDRSEPVGFKPGEDLNVQRTIRLRRRIE